MHFRSAIPCVLLAGALAGILPGCCLDRRCERIAPHAAGALAADALDAEPLTAPAGDGSLFLSGGGQWGAYGAGVLSGWADAASGRDFAFDMVTGISTGALLSTHAFLGTRGDLRLLERVYTSTDDPDILSYRPLLALPFAESVADSGPLADLLREHVDDATIDRVAAAAYDSQGRRRRELWVGTVGLDSGLLLVWDMTLLARKRRYDDYRAVLLASASIPVVFPPVDLAGEPHVDGGVRRQLLVRRVAQRVARRSELTRSESARAVYVIVNGKLGASPACVPRCLTRIAARSLLLMLDEGMARDVAEAHAVAQRGTFRWTKVRSDFPDPPSGLHENFDPEFMRALFAEGRKVGLQGSWLREPPQDVSRESAPTASRAPPSSP